MIRLFRHYLPHVVLLLLGLVLLILASGAVRRAVAGGRAVTPG